MPKAKGNIVVPTDEGDRWEYVFSRYIDFQATVLNDLDLWGKIAHGAEQHLLRDYRRAEGIRHLQYTVIRPYFEWLVWKDGKKPKTLLMILCEEGAVSADEARNNVGQELITEAEIRKRAKAIRIANGNKVGRGSVRRYEDCGDYLRTKSRS